MEDQKFILLEDIEEPVNKEWNYVVVVPAKDYDTVSKIVENSIAEYRESDRDEYYRGFLWLDVEESELRDFINTIKNTKSKKELDKITFNLFHY